MRAINGAAAKGQGHSWSHNANAPLYAGAANVRPFTHEHLFGKSSQNINSMLVANRVGIAFGWCVWNPISSVLAPTQFIKCIDIEDLMPVMMCNR